MFFDFFVIFRKLYFSKFCKSYIPEFFRKGLTFCFTSLEYSLESWTRALRSKRTESVPVCLVVRLLVLSWAADARPNVTLEFYRMDHGVSILHIIIHKGDVINVCVRRSSASGLARLAIPLNAHHWLLGWCWAGILSRTVGEVSRAAQSALPSAGTKYQFFLYEMP